MHFLKNFFINLGSIFLIGLITYLIFPDIMKAVFQTYFQLFGPLAMIILIAYSLPRNWRKKR